LTRPLQTRSHVDAVAEDVVLFSDYVAEIDPYTESDALVLGRFGIAICHRALHLDRATHRIDHAWELAKEAVASILYDAAPMLLDFRIDQLPEICSEPRVRPLLIRPHKARVPGNIGGEDHGEQRALLARR
jgi:hypothetical protein